MRKQSHVQDRLDLFIMDECMSKAIAEPRTEVGEFAPKIIQMQIDPQKIGDVVGQRGKTINAIIEADRR